MKTLKVTTKGKQRKVVDLETDRYDLFIREKICIAKANIQARREGKILIPDESLLSYLVSTPDY